jgi:hypothetical protein
MSTVFGRRQRERCARRTACRAPVTVLEGLECRRLLALVNGEFEAGDLGGWGHVQSEYGDIAAVVASYQASAGPAYAPVEGNRFALLVAANGGHPTTLTQDFHAEPGDTVSGWAFYDNGNPVDQPSYGYVAVKAGPATVATPFSATAESTGDFGQTPWTQWSYTFTEGGNYRVEAGAKDLADGQDKSYLGLDAVEFSGTRDPGQPQFRDLSTRGEPADEGEGLELSGTFVDVTPGDLHQIVIAWGDGTQTVPLAKNGAPPDVRTGYLNPANGHAYYVLDEYQTWAAGDARARALGGHLVTINDAAEQQWVWYTIGRGRGGGPVWLGLNDAGEEGRFAWASGETPAYSNWHAGQPDDAAPGEDYAVMAGEFGGEWADTDGSFARPVVEVDRPVDFGGPPGAIDFYADHVYLDNPATGPHQFITVTVTDAAGLSSTAVTSVLCRNENPLASAEGPSAGVPGQTLHYAGSMSDPGDADVLTPAWEVTDAEGGVVATGDAATFEFTPTAPGDFMVWFQCTDDGFGVSNRSGVPLTVEPAQLQPDPARGGRTVLFVGGTTGDDNIILRPAAAGAVQVFLNGASVGTFAPAAGLVKVFGQAGDDRVTVQRGVTARVVFYGGDGDDTLWSMFYGDVIFGGAGDDRALLRARLLP